jgi:hypothetical protein
MQTHHTPTYYSGVPVHVSRETELKLLEEFNKCELTIGKDYDKLSEEDVQLLVKKVRLFTSLPLCVLFESKACL